MALGTVDKCTCIPSYCSISSNYPAYICNDRDKVTGRRREREREGGRGIGQECHGGIILLDHAIFIRERRAEKKRA